MKALALARGSGSTPVAADCASLIGHEEVARAPRLPRAHRLLLGDHIKVQITS